MTTPEELQRRYYADTASSYEAMRGGEEASVERVFDYIAAFLGMLGASSVLDVGAGTGRALRYLHRSDPTLTLRGVEPVPELVEQASDEIAAFIEHGRGEQLPFPDDSFDAVIEVGVLHHIRDPEPVIREMMRVARRGVFLADANRFGQGPYASRLAKLALTRLGLWPTVDRLKTRGRGYRVSEGDGISYSYSVYDSYDLIDEWADEIVALPGGHAGRGWFSPVLTNASVVLCGLKRPREGK